MKYKTEYSGCFNEDDFAQRGETLEELTVTITLCEYRNMVRELARSELQIERLQDEKEKLLDENGKLSNALAACKLPEWVKSIGRALAGEDAADEEAEDGEKEPGEEMKRLTERTREGVRFGAVIALEKTIVKAARILGVILLRMTVWQNMKIRD